MRDKDPVEEELVLNLHVYTVPFPKSERQEETEFIKYICESDNMSQGIIM